eukprot:5502022-Lingulodinium_polyedra.AAC.1
MSSGLRWRSVLVQPAAALGRQWHSPGHRPSLRASAAILRRARDGPPKRTPPRVSDEAMHTYA